MAAVHELALRALRNYSGYSPLPPVDDSVRSAHFDLVIDRMTVEERDQFIELEKHCHQAFQMVQRRDLVEAAKFFETAWQKIKKIDPSGQFYPFALSLILSREAFLAYRQGDLIKGKKGLEKSFENFRLCEITYASPTCRLYAAQIFCHLLQIQGKLGDHNGVIRNGCHFIRYIHTGECAGLQALPPPWNMGWENSIDGSFEEKYYFENLASIFLLKSGAALAQEGKGSSALFDLISECRREGSNLTLDNWLNFQMAKAVGSSNAKARAAIDLIIGLSARYRHNLADAVASELESYARNFSLMTTITSQHAV